MPVKSLSNRRSCYDNAATVKSPIPRTPIPAKPLHCGVICFIVPLLATALVAWGVRGLERYGYGLFVGLPIVTGLLTALLYIRGREWRWLPAMGLTAVNLLLCAGWLLMFRIEGGMCIFLAALLVAVMALLGLLICWFIDRLGEPNDFHALALLILPLFMKWEAGTTPELPLMEETSVIEVNASPETVWRFIPSFPEIPGDPPGWMATGLACPLRAEMDGSGPGAARRCVLTTGIMPEVVTVWEPGRRLEFDVLSTPPSMVETNPFGEVHAPHTDGYFQSKRGRFILTALPDGRTRIEGTSWFTQNLQPAWYWGPITRYTVRQVHRRVLEHVRTLAEEAAAQGTALAPVAQVPPAAP